MKFALIGSAPSSILRGPYSDPSWKIWACSPGAYYQVPRVDAWFEVHRWEPPVLGKPDQQKPWFSPEYVAWMGQLKCPVWMATPVPEIPTSKALPYQELRKKYGDFFWTSSLAYMSAMAIEAILHNRKLIAAGDPAAELGEDCIGLWGVDMAADEEVYSGQRAGCQFFVTLAASLEIKIVTPPESDLMVPPAPYGLAESSHRHIKYTVRRNELMNRKAAIEQQVSNLQANLNHINGALDDMKYWSMWLHEGEIVGTNFEDIFAQSSTSASTGAEVIEFKDKPATA